MNRKTVPVLLAIIAGLLLMLLVLRGNEGERVSGELLLPNFGPVANDTTSITIQGPEGSDAVALRRVEEQWQVSNRDNYAADIGKLRQLVIALAEARILEEKTSDPALYERLGVDDPESGGKGSRVTVAGADFEYTVILGNQTQGKYRYARDAAAAPSYLLDKDPSLPTTADDWLLADLLDIAAKRVRQVRIAHADGETIVISKDTEEQTDFSVLDMPAGRELSYATVANGIGGALSALKLESVRPGVESPATTTTEFLTWDGLAVTAEIIADGDASWIRFSAATSDAEATATDEAADINRRLAGWQYQLPDYKKDLLVRRWDDLLKAID
ncbi:MAG: DUF4340 domain-containing protein [Gammaproteobacteria bacterium]|nr:DUF4340 domain-containing protein [Gammaproteobacteria bacterium]MDH5321787.1 DUF4340 domain-containing protein [Gammaproteobacteria bacterium]